jgi:MFS superfamily sulfate permease-like transporter
MSILQKLSLTGAVLLFLTPLFFYTPYAVLGAIVISASISRTTTITPKAQISSLALDG